MNQKQWKYKIGSEKAPVIISFVMLTLFGALAIWLYSAQNSAFVFVGLLAIVMLLVFTCTIYRLLFYKVLIDKDGFYFQTSPANGKYYEYAKTEKAWISTGTAQNGAQQEFCNIVVPGESVIRFQFFFNDTKGVEYLVKKVEASSGKGKKVSTAVTGEYLIDGKVFGKTRMVIGFVLLAVVAVIDAVIVQSSGLIYLIAPGAIMAVAIVWLLIVRYFYFKVQIGENGFYCRTNPFDGRHYEYSEIISCREIKKVIRIYNRGRGTNRTYYFYFEFTDVRGKTQKFQFEKPIHEFEVNVLRERIERKK